MTVQIRRHVFETNSSSSHSVSYSSAHKEIDFDAIQKEIGNQEHNVRFGDYHWGIETLYSFDEKLSYVLTAIGQYLDRAEQLAEQKEFIWLSSMLKEVVGIELVIDNPELTDLGGIDHQSHGMLSDEGFWGSTEDEFKSNICRLLFSDDISILIDNDNH